MSLINDLKKELKDRNKMERLTKDNKIILERVWFKSQPQVCKKCGRTNRLTIDHIIPKDILKSFGVDTDRDYDEENLMILCEICNRFKANRLDFSIPKTKQLLIKLINEL